MIAALKSYWQERTRAERQLPVDPWLLGTALGLLALGLVMVCSASLGIADKQFGQPFYFFIRQFTYAAIGLFAGFLVWRTRLVHWEKHGTALFVLGVVFLILVLIPGLGRQVNGSSRWVPLGLFNLQASEPMKLFVIVYMAGYLVRHGQQVRTTLAGFIKPMAPICLVAVLLLLEPDFGATSVIMATTLGLLFLGGVRFGYFGVLMLLAVSAFAVLAISSPYRMARLTGFLNPWADPYDKGFQLTQALIAFGRGEWWGVGLGGSVQKLFYLPEAHTDFVFAVLAEELGLMGCIAVIALFSVFVWRAFRIALRAERSGLMYGAYLAYGIALWIGMQAFINMGVNMGLLPTKGLTLPLVSYGGSSIIIMCMAVALVLRVDHETRHVRGRDIR